MEEGDELVITPMIAMLLFSTVGQTNVDVGKIMQESARVTDADREANPAYDYNETDLEPDGSRKTYAVHMLFGSPYQELIAVNGKPLDQDKRDDEKRKLNKEIARREHESAEDHDRRVQQFQKEQNRDHRMMQELVRAFDFKLIGEQRLDNHDVYVVQATPRPGYRALDNESKVLTGMRGRLWIDKETYQWVKVEASVVHPVSIEGFVARVEPGTRFEVENSRVDNGVWLPKHYSMTARARILSIFHHRDHDDETYFNYHKAAPAPSGANDQTR